MPRNDGAAAVTYLWRSSDEAVWGTVPVFGQSDHSAMPRNGGVAAAHRWRRRRSPLGEERDCAEAGERLVGRTRLEALGGVEHLRQQLDVSDGVEEDVGPAEHPVHGEVDLSLV